MFQIGCFVSSIFGVIAFIVALVLGAGVYSFLIGLIIAVALFVHTLFNEDLWKLSALWDIRDSINRGNRQRSMDHDDLMNGLDDIKYSGSSKTTINYNTIDARSVHFHDGQVGGQDSNAGAGNPGTPKQISGKTTRRPRKYMD